MTYEALLARYERFKSLWNDGHGMTMEALGEGEVPPLSKSRVQQILQHPPKPIGRPRKALRKEVPAP